MNTCLISSIFLFRWDDRDAVEKGPHTHTHTSSFSLYGKVSYSTVRSTVRSWWGGMGWWNTTWCLRHILFIFKYIMTPHFQATSWATSCLSHPPLTYRDCVIWLFAFSGVGRLLALGTSAAPGWDGSDGNQASVLGAGPRQTRQRYPLHSTAFHSLTNQHQRGMKWSKMKMTMT